MVTKYDNEVIIHSIYFINNNHTLSVRCIKLKRNNFVFQIHLSKFLHINSSCVRKWGKNIYAFILFIYFCTAYRITRMFFCPQISAPQSAQVCRCVLWDGRENTSGSASPPVTARFILSSTSSSVSDQSDHSPVQRNVVSPSVPSLLQPVALPAGSTHPHQQVRHTWPSAQNNHSQTHSVKLIIIPNTQIHAEIFQETICWPLQMSTYNNSLETHTHTHKYACRWFMCCCHMSYVYIYKYANKRTHMHSLLQDLSKL